MMLFLSCILSMSIKTNRGSNRRVMTKMMQMNCLFLCVSIDCAASSLGEDQGEACRKHPWTVGDEQDRTRLDLWCSEYEENISIQFMKHWLLRIEQHATQLGIFNGGLHIWDYDLWKQKLYLPTQKWGNITFLNCYSCLIGWWLCDIFSTFMFKDTSLIGLGWILGWQSFDLTQCSNPKVITSSFKFCFQAQSDSGWCVLYFDFFTAAAPCGASIVALSGTEPDISHPKESTVKPVRGQNTKKKFQLLGCNSHSMITWVLVLPVLTSKSTKQQTPFLS